MSEARKPYPFDMSGEEWSLVVPYMALISEEALSHGSARMLYFFC